MRTDDAFDSSGERFPFPATFPDGDRLSRTADRPRGDCTSFLITAYTHVTFRPPPCCCPNSSLSTVMPRFSVRALLLAASLLTPVAVHAQDTTTPAPATTPD